MEMEIKLAYENNREIKELFLEYTEMLVKNDSNFAKYLEVQNYDSELEHLVDKYGLPNGRLYIVKIENETDEEVEFIVFRFVPDRVDKREIIKNDKVLVNR